MKLNFSTLAKQVDNQEDQTINHAKPQDASSQLNYYRKSVVDQKAYTFGRQRKSQLNEEGSQLLLGSSILESYFSARESTVGQQAQQPKVNLSVMYPYQISATLNPSKIDQQIHSMRAKGILNQSAMKFVKKEITKNLSKSKQKKKEIQNLNQSVDQVHQSIFLDTSIEVDQQNLTDVLNNMTEKQFENVGDGSILGTTVSSKLFKHFLRESTQKFIGQSKPLRNEKTLSVKQLMTPITKKKHQNTYSKQSITPHYMNPIHRQQKSKQTQKQPIPTQTIKLEQALKQVRSKPSLQLTKSSPFTQKIIQQRQSQYHSKNTSVFDSLYNQAYKRQCLNELKKQSKEKQIDQKINQKKTLQTKRAQKYKVQGNFMERLEKSIQRKYYKEYLTKKYSVNPKTGQPFFIPDTNCSKRTYEELFQKSLQKLQIQPNDSLSLTTTLKDNLQAKRKSNKISEIALSTHLSHTQKSGRQTKQNSKNKRSQLQRLNRSMEIMTKSSRQLTESRSKAIVDKQDSKVIQRIVRLFYPFLNDGKSSGKEKAINEDLGFQKTYEALFQLSEKEYVILSPLFQQVQQLQKSSKVTSLIFTNILTQFFKKLNHYDKVFLRQKVSTKGNKQPKLNEKQQKPRAFQKSVDSRSNYNNDSNQEKKCSYRPKINEISASMEKINPKYEAELYYV